MNKALSPEANQIVTLLANTPGAMIRRVLTFDRGWIAQVFTHLDGLALLSVETLDELIDSGFVQAVPQKVDHYFVKTDEDKIAVVPGDAVVITPFGEPAPIAVAPPPEFELTEKAKGKGKKGGLGDS